MTIIHLHDSAHPMRPFTSNRMPRNGRCFMTCTQPTLTAIQFSCLWTVTENPQRPYINAGWICKGECGTVAYAVVQGLLFKCYTLTTTMWLPSKFLWWSFCNCCNMFIHGFQLYILHDNMVISPEYLLLNRAEDCLHFNSCNYLHKKNLIYY
jgi:hypothetical protein